MGSFLFAKLLGLENNIYLQTGVIMLIGLLAKTAILITEYAIERRRKGMGIVESAYSAAQVRFASYPDDGVDNDFRYASADVLFRCRCQW